MLLKSTQALACAFTLAAAFLLPSQARAQVACDSLTNLPNHVYGVGGSAVTATLKKISLAIAKDPNKTADRTTIFYNDELSACPGYAAFLSGKATGRFRYWVEGIANDADQFCDAAAGGQPVSFSHMGNDAEFCPQGELPDGIGDFVAPIQTLNVVTDVKSNELAISAEALYFIYGFGATGQAAPWTAGTGVARRQPDSFASLLLATAIDVPPTAFNWPAETIYNTQSALIAALNTYATTEALARQTIGYVSGSAADTNRTKVRTLAYQHYGQAGAVYPDSAVNTFDKIHVRTGKYYLWAPGHYYTKVDAEGVPLDERVANLIGWFSKDTVPPGTTVNAFEQSILAGDIPQCAMQVQREGTLGAFSSYQAPKPCGCYFEKVTNPNVTSSCTPCDDDSQCGGDAAFCNFGYCEGFREEGQEEG